LISAGTDLAGLADSDHLAADWIDDAAIDLRQWATDRVQLVGARIFGPGGGQYR